MKHKKAHLVPQTTIMAPIKANIYKKDKVVLKSVFFIALSILCVSILIKFLLEKNLLITSSIYESIYQYSFQTMTDYFFTQLSLTFISISVMSVLSDKSVTVLWENMVNRNLVYPKWTCFFSYTIYSFATVGLSIMAMIFRMPLLLLFCFFADVFILAMLTFSMIDVYFNLTEKKHILCGEFIYICKNMDKCYIQEDSYPTTVQKSIRKMERHFFDEYGKIEKQEEKKYRKAAKKREKAILEYDDDEINSESHTNTVIRHLEKADSKKCINKKNKLKKDLERLQRNKLLSEYNRMTSALKANTLLALSADDMLVIGENLGFYSEFFYCFPKADVYAILREINENNAIYFGTLIVRILEQCGLLLDELEDNVDNYSSTNSHVDSYVTNSHGNCYMHCTVEDVVDYILDVEYMQKLLSLCNQDMVETIFECLKEYLHAVELSGENGYKAGVKAKKNIIRLLIYLMENDTVKMKWINKTIGKSLQHFAMENEEDEWKNYLKTYGDRYSKEVELLYKQNNYSKR